MSEPPWSSTELSPCVRHCAKPQTMPSRSCGYSTLFPLEEKAKSITPDNLPLESMKKALWRPHQSHSHTQQKSKECVEQVLTTSLNLGSKQKDPEQEQRRANAKRRNFPNAQHLTDAQNRFIEQINGQHRTLVLFLCELIPKKIATYLQ